MRPSPLPMLLAILASGCAGHDRLAAVDTRAENVGHQRLDVVANGAGAGAIEPYALRTDEGYRMPQLHTAPPPVLRDRDPRQELPATTVCLQLVVNAEGRVERSLPVTDRNECDAGAIAGNAVLLQAASEAVAMWRFWPAAVCHFAPGTAPRDAGDCSAAERVEPTPVSLLYAFTFEIVRGQQFVRSHGR